MLGLSVALIVAQLADMVWPREDSRAATPASVVFATALAFLLALYPNGRFVPRWTAIAAGVATLLFAASAVAGPDVSARALWPLPIAVVLVALAVGGQGYRYMRRSSADEREAVRWPLLGVLVLLTVVVPADGVSIALTGSPLTAGPVLAAVVQVAYLLPGVGFVAGLYAPRTELVDRLLAIWVAVVVAGAALAAVFALVLSVAHLWLADPWPAWIGAGAVALAALLILPLARRVGRILVFRGRADTPSAVAMLNGRLAATLDIADIPAEIAAAVADATGSADVTLRRWGQQNPWARAERGPASGAVPWRTTVTHLGLPLATMDVAPRPGESGLASEDRRIVEAMVAAAAPALHGARLASAFPELTDRERQVLAGIVRGLPNAAIAERLGVSSKTVANYVSIVLTKLRVPDKERAAELARRRAAEVG